MYRSSPASNVQCKACRSPVSLDMRGAEDETARMRGDASVALPGVCAVTVAATKLHATATKACASGLRVVVIAAVAILAGATAVAAQGANLSQLPSTIFVGTEAENYLRQLQTLGLVERYPWSVRAFSPVEIDQLGPRTRVHPWRDQPGLERSAYKKRGVAFEFAPLTLGAWYNSAEPYGFNDGAVWVGRGATFETQFGAAARWRGLSLTLAPASFIAENRAFALRQRGRAGRSSMVTGRSGIGWIIRSDSARRRMLAWIPASLRYDSTRKARRSAFPRPMTGGDR